ncbi:3-isopropylmalate dehydrogenase [Fusarium sp. AF-6]|nr:3-isopropylmalate dehydrogenase [Fusarium sp. AF-6]
MCWRSSVIAEGIRVLKTIEENKLSVGKFYLWEHLMGGCSIDATGSPLIDETLAAAKAADAVLPDSISGPEWGTSATCPEQGLLKLRKEMGTYGQGHGAALDGGLRTKGLGGSANNKEVGDAVVKELTQILEE